jgi:hypothetical protein
MIIYETFINSLRYSFYFDTKFIQNYCQRWIEKFGKKTM